jgi:hypothetical protein
MQIDAARIERLIDLSRDKSYDAYTRFEWPETLKVEGLWCNEDLLTSYGTPYHKELSDEQLYNLSKWEAINFYSLNVHGIKTVLEFVCRCIYEPRYSSISEYMHFFMAEENAHMWFFAKFCKQYGGKIYFSPNINISPESEGLEQDLYMFASTLIFEEFVDYYNHRVGKNESVPKIVREINYQHHIDESRHVSFGREVVKELFEEIKEKSTSDEQMQRISRTFKGLIGHFITLMYCRDAYEDAGVYAPLGFNSAAAMRNSLRHHPDRSEHHKIWFRRTAHFFEKQGIIDNTEFLMSA